MNVGKIAVIGDSSIVTLFKAVGMDVFPVNDENEAESTIRRIAKDYAIIYITENYAVSLRTFLDRFTARTYPIIISIPGAGESLSFGMNRIRENVERAVGINILDD